MYSINLFRRCSNLVTPLRIASYVKHGRLPSTSFIIVDTLSSVRTQLVSNEEVAANALYSILSENARPYLRRRNNGPRQRPPPHPASSLQQEVNLSCSEIIRTENKDEPRTRPHTDGGYDIAESWQSVVSFDNQRR